MRLSPPRLSLWVLCAVCLWAAPAHGDDLKDSITQMEAPSRVNAQKSGYLPVPAPPAPAVPQDPFWRSVHRLKAAVRGLSAGEFHSEMEYSTAAPEEISHRSRMILTLILSSLTGGSLVAIGLVHVAMGSWRERIKTAFGPAVVHAGPPPAACVLTEAALGAPMSGATAKAMVDAYQITKKIGAGGMGVVYEAFDRALQRRVAIKQLREGTSSDSVESILHEARMVAALRHPNIVEIYSIVDSGSGIYLVFEYLDGLTVAEHIRKRGRIPFSWALSILQSVGSALDYAHKRDIVHRDLKPSNIMIDQEGVVKVMDFGVARRGKDTLDPWSSKNAASGTPPYMAPEQESGTARKESDVYAMGVTLYEMVTGRLPFSGPVEGMSQSKMKSAYIPPSVIAPNLPAHFDRVLSWALTPDPNKRWRTPGQFLRNLENLSHIR